MRGIPGHALVPAPLQPAAAGEGHVRRGTRRACTEICVRTRGCVCMRACALRLVQANSCVEKWCILIPSACTAEGYVNDLHPMAHDRRDLVVCLLCPISCLVARHASYVQGMSSSTGLFVHARPFSRACTHAALEPLNNPQARGLT